MDRWSQGTSPLHRHDARAKILTLLVFLMVIASTPADAFAILATDTAVAHHRGGAILPDFRLAQLGGGRTLACAGAGGKKLSLDGRGAVAGANDALAVVARRPGTMGAPDCWY